ncbi:hypothetical protein PORCRE_588 [Porphyromonas crevioricanis JCM 15906]|uniref:Uncharacterized protein n=1 Tax=Porphyromonas crevioricanis JCM 15906 TaxID=1305617 RepID=T1CGP3_9PORP|nr:hypothetical protein PORCRE_588 [Porphyromonas crevioricanis JCM 15906]GAD06827.1 hypothetical protein PORCAN_435 [Porphyromonas crevioricanis JCM 13913]
MLYFQFVSSLFSIYLPSQKQPPFRNYWIARYSLYFFSMSEFGRI